MKKSTCDSCKPGAFPLSNPGFTRRSFLQLTGAGLLATCFPPVLSAALREQRNVVAPVLHGTARNCIVVFLAGAPSQIDTWDLKEGAWTPKAFAPESYGDVRFPRGLLPQTAAHLDKLAIVRSGLAWVAVHPLGQSWAQIGRNPAAPLGNVSPHIGSVVALELEKTRTAAEVLPAFVALENVKARSGYFPAVYGPLEIHGSDGGVSTLQHPDGIGRLNKRLALLAQLDSDRRTGALGKNADDLASFYGQCNAIASSSSLSELFVVGDEDHARYGASGFGDSMAVARKLIASHRGTRFVQVTFENWDHHDHIYDASAQFNLFGQAKQFDPAFGALLDDLAATPGEGSGRSLLDETLVVVLSEFGRTVGPLSRQNGRDHFPGMSIVFAGGGVAGGRALGATDAAGNASDFGWSAHRNVRVEDVTSTIYSALSIDYTTVRYDDPLHRGFEYVPSAKDGIYRPIDELFA
jgi:hypothetical protein